MIDEGADSCGGNGEAVAAAIVVRPSEVTEGEKCEVKGSSAEAAVLGMEQLWLSSLFM